MPTRDQVQRLIADEQTVLSVIGAYAVSAAQRAFIDQRSPTGKAWPARYPNQGEDFLNVAGSLVDMETGARIKGRRYDRLPAGRDTGDLIGRLTYEVRPGELAVGSDVPYARKFQEGGESSQELTASMIRNLEAFLRRKPANGVERKRLGPVLASYRRGVRRWVTTSPPRPFAELGEQDVDDLAEQLLETAERY